MFLLTEQLLEAKWKGHICLSKLFSSHPPQYSCAGANSKSWRVGLE